MAEALKWTVEPAARLDAQMVVWDDLNSRTFATPLLDGTLLRLLLREYGTGKEWIAVCRSGEKIVAATILRRRNFAVWETFQAMQAPVGAWLQTRDFSLQTLVAALIPELPGFCLLIGIMQQDPDFVARPAGERLTTLDYIETPRISIKSSFEEYWRARSNNLKQNMRTQRNRLGRESIVTRLETIVEPDRIGAAIDAFGLMESAGWKASEGTAVHPDNEQGRLYRAWFEYLSARGEATVYRYYYGEKLVACDLWIHRNDVRILLKTTYDEKESVTSPTMLMRQEIFEDFFGKGTITKLELYGRLVDWQKRWTEETRIMYHVNIYRWRWLRSLALSRAKKKAAVVPSQ